MRNHIRHLITGPTGSGKTYEAIRQARALGGWFCYMAPTALLTFDAYAQYSIRNNDKLDAKGIEYMLDDPRGDFYTTFKAVNQIPKRVSTLIIDEAHWVMGGFGLQANKIQSLLDFEGNIILVTGTCDFYTPDGYTAEKLKPRFKKQIEFISNDEFNQRWRAGVPSMDIDFSCRAVTETGLGYISGEEKRNELWQAGGCVTGPELAKCLPNVICRWVDELSIIKRVKAFNKGEINFLSASNIAAQGVNITCENLRISYFSTCIDLVQKVGRLGRLQKHANTRLTVTGVTESEYRAALKYLDCDHNWREIEPVWVNPNEEEYVPPYYSSEEIQEFMTVLIT